MLKKKQTWIWFFFSLFWINVLSKLTLLSILNDKRTHLTTLLILKVQSERKRFFMTKWTNIRNIVKNEFWSTCTCVWSTLYHFFIDAFVNFWNSSFDSAKCFEWSFVFSSQYSMKRFEFDRSFFKKVSNTLTHYSTRFCDQKIRHENLYVFRCFSWILSNWLFWISNDLNFSRKLQDCKYF